MTTRQFEVLYERLGIIESQNTKIISQNKQLLDVFNSLPEGTNITGRIGIILQQLQKDVASLKDEIRM